MKITTFVAAAVVGTLGFGAAAMAHEMDTDEDGLYTLTEMRTEYPDMTEADYDALDTNADGALDKEELEVAWEKGLLAPME